MAASYHLGFYQTAHSVIRSADPENAGLEPNMEWIGCTVCEIFTFKLYCDLETGVRGHSRSSKVALFDTARTTLYSFSILNMPLSITVAEIKPHIGRKSLPLPLYSAPLLRVIYATTLGDEKLEWCTIIQWKNFDDAFSRFDKIHACDGQTDRRNCRGISALQHFVVAHKIV